MKHWHLIVFLLFGLTTSSYGQSSIKTIKKFNYTSNFNFTGEWQYLTTHLYLFNHQRFSKLINDLHKKNKKHYFRKIQSEKIEYLMITANIRDIKYFGGDLNYPIYSFQTSFDEEGAYRVNVSDNDEVIRLIDNLPLTPGISGVDATIEGKIITDRSKDKVIRAIADQLISLSEIPDPSAAALSVIRELGRFMKNSTTKNLYKFNSTIRLYESQDFNKQFYSLDLYVFLPTDKKSTYIDTDNIQDFFAENSDPEINRQKLEELIAYKNYPYFAVVNYKSKYTTEEISGDEITVAAIRKRRQRIEKKFEQGNIPNKIAYNHELLFLEFLEQFAELKSQVNTYRLYKKNELSNDFSRTMLLLSELYLDLLKTFESREKEFNDEPNFCNSFRSKYQHILNKAGLYFEFDIPLKNVKQLVNSIMLLDDVDPYTMLAGEREKHLRNIYSVELPTDDDDAPFVQFLESAKTRLEGAHFREDFSKLIQQLNNANADDAGQKIKDELLEKAKLTQCMLCKQQSAKAIESFNQHYDIAQKKLVLAENSQIIIDVRETIFEALQYEYQIDNYFKFKFDTVPLPPHIQMIKEISSELIIKRQILQEFIKLNFQEMESETIIEYNQNLLNLNQTIRKGYESICSKIPELCR